MKLPKKLNAWVIGAMLLAANPFTLVASNIVCPAPSVAPELSSATTLTPDGIINIAMKFIGVPYRRGSSSPKGFDCSGFTSYVFKLKDIILKRSSREQFTQGERVASRKDLRRGDLVFFGGSRGRNSVSHVGIVKDVNEDGTFTFVHAARTGIKVDKSIAPYYSKRYIGARRILTD